MDPDSGGMLSLDENMGDTSTLSPSDDIVAFHELVNHMTETLDSPSVFIEESSHPGFDILGAATREMVTLYLLEGLFQ